MQSNSGRLGVRLRLARPRRRGALRGRACAARTCGRRPNGWARARAAAGASLGETLADVDGLTDGAAGHRDEVLHRAVSLGWADRMMDPPITVFDPLTGLVSRDYLRTRLGEVYRAGDSAAARCRPVTRWSSFGWI